MSGMEKTVKKFMGPMIEAKAFVVPHGEASLPSLKKTKLTPTVLCGFLVLHSAM
jgi:hypothetical protein